MSFGASLMIGMGWEKLSLFGKYPCPVRRPWPQAGRAPARKDRPSCAHCEVLQSKSEARNVLQRTVPEPAARSQQPLSELTAGLPSTPNHQPCLCEAVLVLWLCVDFLYVLRVYFGCKASCVYKKNLPGSFGGPTNLNQFPTNFNLLLLIPIPSPQPSSSSVRLRVCIVLGWHFTQRRQRYERKSS